MIDIFVTTYNRKDITERCLTIIKDNLTHGCNLQINDDGSTEYDKK